MKGAKKYIVLLTVIFVLVAAAAGGVYAYQKYQEENLQAEVLSVANLNMGWWGDPMSSSGYVSDDYTQSIHLEDKTVAEIKVEEGAPVNAGDPLIVYDTTEIQIQIDMKKLELQGIKNDIILAERELERLKKIKPVSAVTPVAPSTPSGGTTQNKKPVVTKEPSVIMMKVPKKDGDAYNYIDETAKPYEGKGTAEKPYRFLCTQECYVMGSYLNWLVTNEQVAAFEIWSGNSVEEGTLLSCWTVNGMKQSMVGGNTKWLVGTQEEIEEGVTIEEETETESETESETQSTPSASETEYEEEYTVEELKREIAEKESEIKELTISRKIARLDLKGMQRSRKKNVVYANINGVVRTVGDPEDPPTDGSAFMEISGAAGMYIKGSISELMLEQIEVGQEISANSWNTGQVYTAVISEISEYPTDERSYGEGNPNVSYYSFMAYIEDSEGLSNGDYLDVSITPAASGENMNALYIEKAYVRTENGRSYVMKAGEDNRLVKQYVETGRTIYGSSVEIKSGLSLEDRIAFPYGKTAKEGVKVTESAGF